MQDKRTYTRVSCNRTCQLHWNGVSYPATVKDMSMVAMGLYFDGAHPDVRRGDFCLISVDDNKATYPYQIIRTNASAIAVGSIGRHKHS